MIALACDHGALDLKKAIMAHLDKRGLAYKDPLALALPQIT